MDWLRWAAAITGDTGLHVNDGRVTAELDRAGVEGSRNLAEVGVSGPVAL